MSKPLAPVSLDLDNKWSYLMVHGDAAWTTYPSYLHTVVPRLLDFLEQRRIQITVFVVGRDATFQEHRDLLSGVAEKGHSIGNHSFDHKPWLHRFSHQQVTDELDRAEDAIEDATGVRPRGFRGPGFSLTDSVLAELSRRGYLYDATVFPNILNPLSRAYYFRTTQLTPEQREERSELFGTLGSAFRPNRPFSWRVAEAALAEVPVTTFPGLRTPIHLSYLTYLAGRSPKLASAYLRAALTACRVTSNAPSMLLHPLDFLGRDDDTDLGFFPGMDMESGKKLHLAHRFLDKLETAYQATTLETYVLTMGQVKERVPDYSS